MEKTSKYYWHLPIIGGIFALLGLFFPTAYHYFEFQYWDFAQYYWLNGLSFSIYSPKDWDLEFIRRAPEMMLPGLISTLLILLSISALIGTANISRKRDDLNINFRIIWFVLGSLFFVATGVYVVGIEQGFQQLIIRDGYYVSSLYFQYNESFWGNFRPQFGTYAPVIGGIIVLIGALFGKKRIKTGV